VSATAVMEGWESGSSNSDSEDVYSYSRTSFSVNTDAEAGVNLTSSSKLALLF